MLFTAYPDEQKIIKIINEYHNEEYVLVRITRTMIEKNNIDANGLLRDLLKNYGIVDYETFNNGGKNGIKCSASFIQSGKIDKIKFNFYKVNNSRSDKRFSIDFIRKRVFNHEINEGDLLYISVYAQNNSNPNLYVINLTHNIPTKQEIFSALGEDKISQALKQIKLKLINIVNGEFYNNSKGEGKLAPKDVGDTLEHLLEINTNNRTNADFQGLIEIKAKGKTSTLDTLFTLRPLFNGTKVAAYEVNDRSRVSAFARLYGYDSDKHPGYNCLYITIGSENNPQNNHGFYLDVDDEKRLVNLMWKNPETGKREISAYWTFDILKNELYLKHPSTLWFKAETRTVGNMVQFKYNDIQFSKAPQFTTFISLVKAGIITYDWRGYTTKEGKYQGKNHGNAWRIKPANKSMLFTHIETIIL